MAQLILPEALLLATLDERGRLPRGIGVGLVGALLSELRMRGRIAVRGGRHLALVDLEPTGDPLLDAAIDGLIGTTLPSDVRPWLKEVERAVPDVVEVVRARVAGMERDRAEHRDALRRVLTDGGRVDQRTGLLISLVSAVGAAAAAAGPAGAATARAVRDQDPVGTHVYSLIADREF